VHDIHPVELDKPELPTHIDTLARRDIISLETPDPELAYFFKHTIAQQVIHGQMTVAQRRQLHRSAADWYERTYAQNLSPFYPLLAYHWSQAEVVTKAIDYLEQAGEQALHSGAYQEAVDFFSQALVLDDEQWPSTRGTRKRTKTKSAIFSLPACPPAQLRRARWERLLGKAYFGLGNLTLSRQHFEQAVALLGCPVPAGRISLVVGLVGQVLQQAGPTKFSNGAPETMREAARAYEQLAHIAYFVQDKILGSKAVLRALNLAQVAGASPELARSYANMSVVAGLITLHPQAKAYSHRARTLARSLDQPAVLAWVLFITSVYDVGIGRWPEVESALDESVKIFRDLKDRRNLAESVSLMAMAASFQGQFRRSVELYADIYKAASRRGDAQARAWGLVGQAVNLWRLGQSEKIVTLLKRALSLLPKNVDHADEIRSYGILALAYLRQGKQLLALQAAEAAAHWIRSSSPAAVAAFEGYASVAEVYLACWETGPNGDYRSVGQETLAKSAQKACKSLRAFAFIFPIAQPRAWLWQGLYEWLAGKPAKAHKAWQKCLATAEQLAIGRHLPLDDPARPEHLSHACEIFTQLDAGYDLNRAREALAARE
jgi:tetratricopeptide (TPR) repeat protein